MSQTWSMAQEIPNQSYVPMAPTVVYPFQPSHPPVTTVSLGDHILFLIMLLSLMPVIVLILAPFGAIALILFFVGRAVRASYTLRAIVGLIGLAIFSQFVLIPFLIDL